MFDSSNLLHNALTSHYEAQRNEAIAILQLYFEDSVGIGEHSNILDEIKKWAAKLAEAEEILEVINNYSEKC